MSCNTHTARSDSCKRAETPILCPLPSFARYRIHSDLISIPKTIDRTLWGGGRRDGLAGSTRLADGKVHVIGSRLFRIRKTIMGLIVSEEATMDHARGYYNQACSFNERSSPSLPSLSRRRRRQRPPFNSSSNVAGRQFFSFLFFKCLGPHLQFTTRPCQPPSSHISSCHTYSHWPG